MKTFLAPLLTIQNETHLESQIAEGVVNITHYGRKGNVTGFHLSRKKARPTEYAYFYLRAFCRLYLTDYICAGMLHVDFGAMQFLSTVSHVFYI